MSDPSPQLAPFLAPAGVLPAQGNALLAGASGLSKNALSPPEAPVDTTFQERLQALLTGHGEAVAELAEVDRLELAAPVRDTPDVAANSALRAALPVDGRLLPASGKNLPPPAVPTDIAQQGDGTLDAELSQRLLAESGPQLGGNRAELAAQLSGGRSFATGPEPAVGAQVADDAAALVAQEQPRQEQTRLLTAVAERSAADQSALKPSAAQPVTAVPVTDVMQRLQLGGAARDRPVGAVTGAEQSVADTIDWAARGSDVLRVTAAADSSATQFNMHARPDGLLPSTPSLTPDSALRDLAGMAPLRPQVGEGSGTWSAGLGQRLLMMAENGVEVARLRLNPASLGPLDIQVSVEDDRAQIWFASQNSATREALEAALPRLREMFAEQGLNLTEANVGDSRAQSDPNGSGDNAGSVPQSNFGADDALADSAGPHPGMQMWGSGGGRALDIYV